MLELRLEEHGHGLQVPWRRVSGVRPVGPGVRLAWDGDSAAIWTQTYI